MISKKTVTTIMIVLTLAIIGFDVLVGTDIIPDNTISEIMAESSQTIPLIPIAWGVLMSHFFFLRSWDRYMSYFRGLHDNRYYFLSLFGIAVALSMLAGIMPAWPTFVYYLIGMVVGYELFPQFKENF